MSLLEAIRNKTARVGVIGLGYVGLPPKGSKILILGIAYKCDVSDPRESPSFVVMEQLLARGAQVSYSDPHVPRLPKMRRHHIEMDSLPLTPDLLAKHDCALILTDHSAYDWPWIVEHSQLVVDTRNATRDVNLHRERIRCA